MCPVLPQMHSILCTQIDPNHLVQLREWFVSEWGEIDPFDSKESGIQIPTPIVITEDDELIGGLSFTSAQKPDSTKIVIWVNAVLVSPKHRRIGVASKLVEAAELNAASHRISELFVYTNVPGLYKKLGWQTLETGGEATVLKKSISAPLLSSA